LKMKLPRLVLTVTFLSLLAITIPANADSVICDQQTFTRDDDSAYNANLPFSLTLGSTEYSNVYVSTNGTMIFGIPDGNYWDYPQTPSVSVAGNDWVTFGEGAYLSFGSTANTFCVEWSVRPYPRSTGELTQIRLVINRASDGGWHGEIVTFGWLPENLRRGIRFEQGQAVVPVEAAFNVNGGVPIEVAPAPTPSSFTEPPIIVEPSPSATVTPEPTPTESPSQTPEPVPSPSETPSESPTPTPEPTPAVEPTPTPEPTLAPVVIPLDTPTPTPEPTPSADPTPSESAQEVVQVSPTPTVEPTPQPSIESSIQPDPQPSEMPLVSQPVTIELSPVLASIPGVKQLAAAAEAVMNVGNDMTPKQRKQAQQMVISAIIITQLARPQRNRK
jgi:hypothetical protein